MGKLSSFTVITLNGCYKGTNEDISWHRHGEEENEYSIRSLANGTILLFGRITLRRDEKLLADPSSPTR